MSLNSFVMNNGVGLDFHEGGFVDQLGDLNHRRRRADRFEELAVDFAGLAPVAMSVT